MLHFATLLMFSTEFKPMETDLSPTVQQVLEMRQQLEKTILSAILQFENSSGCHVDWVDLTSPVVLGSPKHVCFVDCRVVF